MSLCISFIKQTQHNYVFLNKLFIKPTEIFGVIGEAI